VPVPNAGGWVKIMYFDRLIRRWLRHLTAEHLCPSATVVHIHNTALVEEHVVSSPSLVVVEIDDHNYGPVDIDKVG